MKVGDRVGAVLSASEDQVFVLGYGVYEGLHPIGPEAVGALACALRIVGKPNPRIRLDSGEIVYGCECWWGPEEQVKTQVAQYDIVHNVSIDEERAKALAEAEADA